MQRTEDYRRHQFLKRRKRALRRAAARHTGDHFEIDGGLVYTGPYRTWRSKTPREEVYVWHLEKKRERSEFDEWSNRLGITPRWKEETKPCPWSDRWVLVRRRHVIGELNYHETPIWKMAGYYARKRCRCDWCVIRYDRPKFKKETALMIEGGFDSWGRDSNPVVWHTAYRGFRSLCEIARSSFRTFRSSHTYYRKD